MIIRNSGLIAFAFVVLLFVSAGLQEYFRNQELQRLPADALFLPTAREGNNRGPGRLPSDPGRAIYFGRCSAALQNLAGTLPNQQATLSLGAARLRQNDLLKASLVIGTLSRMLEVNEERPSLDRNRELRLFARQFPGQDERLVVFATNCVQASYKYANQYSRARGALARENK